MKVLFFYPEIGTDYRYADWIEIGVSTAMLRVAGFQVECIYWKSERQAREIERSIEQLKPDILVALMHPDQVAHSRRLLMNVKGSNPQLLMVCAGFWPTLSPAEVFESGIFDTWISAEWEPAFLELATSYRNTMKAAVFPNVTIKQPGGQISSIPPRPPAHPLDSLPHPDRDIFPWNDILQLNGGEMPLQASRGCPYQCAFCHEPVYAKLQRVSTTSTGTPSQRRRSPRRVIEEARALSSIYMPQRFIFTDPVFPREDRWLSTFADLWSREVAQPFTATVVAEVCTPSMLDQLQRAGCDQVLLGIETGNELNRQLISDRNLGNSALLYLRDELRKRNIGLITTNMIGLPRDTPQDLEATVLLNQSLEPAEVRTQVFRPLPETAISQYLAAHRIEASDSAANSTHPDLSPLVLPGVTQEMLSATYDRLLLLDSILKSRRRKSDSSLTLDVLAEFAAGRFRSPHRRAARLARWRCQGELRDVLTLRAPTEMSFQFEAQPNCAVRVGLTAEPALKGLRSPRTILFSIKIEQDSRSFRLFRKALVPALDPDARRWHDYVLPLRDIRPGPCTLTLQVRLPEEEQRDLPPEEEVWGGWSNVGVLTMNSGAPEEALHLEVQRGSWASGAAIPIAGEGATAGGGLQVPGIPSSVGSWAKAGTAERQRAAAAGHLPAAPQTTPGTAEGLGGAAAAQRFREGGDVVFEEPPDELRRQLRLAAIRINSLTETLESIHRSLQEAEARARDAQRRASQAEAALRQQRGAGGGS